MVPVDSFRCRRELLVQGKKYTYVDLPTASQQGLGELRRLPFSLKILLENLLRHEDGQVVTSTDIKAIADWVKNKRSDHEIAYHPARVLMQDFTGVPAIVDLAAMRDALQKFGGNPDKINPLCPVDLVIDHSVQVDRAGSTSAFQDNVNLEMERNYERYAFLRWGQSAFRNFRVVPPGTGICHQVNLEYLAQVVWQSNLEQTIWAYPDTLVGTDSHTTMINGLGVLGWGVGGIEAEAAMLGQPISMLIPEVVGCHLTGQLKPGVTATDLVLTITQLLRQKGVVGKFVEFYGAGLDHLPLADRATIANMAPEYGATCGFFPIDTITLDYLRLTGREASTIALVEAYSKAQGLWRTLEAEPPVFTDQVALDLSTVETSLAGPKRPQDRVPLSQLRETSLQLITTLKRDTETTKTFTTIEGKPLQHNAVVIAAITSCTNTSNPSVLIAAGLLAQNACAKGLKVKPWVKTSLAPGSKVVTEYLAKAGLDKPLNTLGFQLVGYGCTTCIGNSGPLSDDISKTITDNDLIVSAVLSGNRNFEGRVHPLVKANWLASPPLVVALALAGSTTVDFEKDALGQDTQGNPVYLRDIWPTPAAISKALTAVDGNLFREQYADVFSGTEEWQAITCTKEKTYTWDTQSTYVQFPPFFENMSITPTPPTDIVGARVLAMFGDSITTDHISPAGSIKRNSPAGSYLEEHRISSKDFNSYGARRGNHEVMMRGTFANIRIRNEMVPDTEGGVTCLPSTGEVLSIFDAAMRYQEQHIPLIIVAGKEYGTGSSRDWAAKGPRLLGVKAVIAESFERIHRSNLIGMGILPLQFLTGTTRKTLELTGKETVHLRNIAAQLKPGMTIKAEFVTPEGKSIAVDLLARIDTRNEVEYYLHGGILHYVLRRLATQQ